MHNPSFYKAQSNNDQISNNSKNNDDIKSYDWENEIEYKIQKQIEKI